MEKEKIEDMIWAYKKGWQDAIDTITQSWKICEPLAESLIKKAIEKK